MLYNILKKKTQEITDCLKCPYFDLKLKQCSGLNKVCFEFDEKTNTVINGITKMPLDLKGE